MSDNQNTKETALDLSETDTVEGSVENTDETIKNEQGITSENGEVQGESQDNNSELEKQEAAISMFEEATGMQVTLSPTEVATLEPQRKTPVSLFIGIGVALIVAIAIFAAVLIGGDPQKAVNKAMEKTGTMMQQQSDTMIKELPAIKAMYGITDGAQQTDFDFTFQSIEGDAVPQEVLLYSSLLNGAGLRGKVISDANTGAIEFDGSAHIGEQDLIGLFMMLNKDKLAFNVPTFSDKILSINPNTFVEDYKKSVFYMPEYDSEESIKEIQDMLTSELAMLGNAGKIGEIYSNQKEMTDKVWEIIGSSLNNAAFEKAPKEDALKVYIAKIPGADVKKAISELITYIYVDSPMGSMYDSMFTNNAAMGGMPWKDMVADMLKQFDSVWPESPVTVTFKIASGSKIEAVNIVMDATTATENNTVAINTMNIDYSLDKDFNAKVRFLVDAYDEVSTVSFDGEIGQTYKDGAYDVNYLMNINADKEKMTFDGIMKFDKEGKYLIDFGMKMPESSGTGNIKFGCDGTFKQDGDKSTWDFPKLYASMDMGGQKAGINLACTTNTVPLKEGYTPSKETTPLLTMTEDELNAEMKKYEDGVNALLGQMLGLILGAGQSAA